MSSSPGQAEAILRRLDWTVLRRLDGLLHGDYRTLTRGAGLDLADLREYREDDDVRRIDWNVTARLHTPHVREYHEDRELNTWFLLDLSPSLDFGSRGPRKREASMEFVTLLARLFTRQGNRVGALFYGDHVDAVIPARAGRRHVLHLLNRMLAQPEMTRSAPTDLADFMQRSFALMQRRSLVFIVSDFISDTAWARPLAVLAQRHEVIAVRLFDPLEFELPDLGMMVVQDAETGEQLFVDTHDRAFRRRFAEAGERREAALRGAFSEAGVDVLELGTDDDLADAVLRFAELRRMRSRMSSGLASGTLPQHLGGRL